MSSMTNVKRADVWDVTCPFPVNPIGGGKGQPHYFPSILPARRRRISVEVRRVKSLFESAAAADLAPPSESEICYVRILQRPLPNPKEAVLDPIGDRLEGVAKKARKRRVSFFGGSFRHIDVSHGDDDSEGDGTVMQSFKEALTIDDGTSSVAGGNDIDDAHADQVFDGWVPKYKIPLRFFRVVERKKRSVVAAFEFKGRSDHRDFVFEDEEAASEFCNIIETNKNLLDGRTKVLMRNALGDIELEKEEQLTLLFDICSGSNLPQCDIGGGSDPYVSVRFAGKRIHKTSYIPQQSCPIWTLRTGALFVWRVDALELFQSEEGLVFEVKDFDTLGSNDSLGAFSVNARTLYKWNGERREFALKPLLGRRNFGGGTIALRARRATEHDLQFMDRFNETWSRGNPNTLTNITVGTTLKSIMTVHSKKEKEGPDKGKTKYLVRPGPDPKRKEATAWLTEERIEEEAARQSHEWMDIGSGSLGKIFVEILGCDDLPNRDKAGVLGDKTDSFVSLVYQDCFARTDVVADCLSPRWMPWTKRAFVLNMMHTSSQLFLAVFDSDSNSMSSHDLIGRVSVELSNFCRDTIYLLHYNLYPTANCGPRESKCGRIKIRLRLELEDERTLLLSNFQWPQSEYVNVEDKKDFAVIQQTVEGSVNMNRFSMKNISTFHEELMTYYTILYVLQDAFTSLLLWRGLSLVHLPMPCFSTRSIKWFRLAIPLHSIVAFACATSLVENPDLLPSICFGCFGWSLLAIAEMRSNTNPNPWTQTKSFMHFLTALIRGKSITGPQVIEAKEYMSDSATENFWDKRIRKAEKRAAEQAEQYAREHEQYLKELEEIGDTSEDLSRSTRHGGGLSRLQRARLPLNVYDPREILHPYQDYLSIACTWLRVFKNIFIWEECYISFLAAVVSFVLSAVSLFIPWQFLFKWALRITVWVAFGPWMKIADIYYFSRLLEETDEEQKERMNKLQLERQKRLDKQKLEAQITREKTTKLRDFKQFLFGKHTCKVNVLKKDRYHDIPLPASTAVPYNPKSKTLGELAMQEAGYRRFRVHGQQLVGDMIPKILETPSTEAPTGKPTKKTSLLDKASPAAFYDGNDSFGAAAVKVGSIIVGAGAITWFGVPLFIHLFRLIIPG